MAGWYSLRWPSGVSEAVQAILQRLLGRGSSKVSESTNDLSGPADADAYTLFEGKALRLRNLSLHPLEDLTGDPGLLPGAFRIRIARSVESREQAGSLLKRRYNASGYQVSDASGDPTVFTFVAYNNGELVGTLGLRLDSEQGLPADQLYKSEMDGLRSSGSRLCEFTRLAVDVNAESTAVLGGLFQTAYLFAYRVRAYDAAVIEVNPRHVGFYERGMGFQRIGPERLSPRVNAPAVLLCIRFETIATSLARYAGKPELGKSYRSLFTYGLSPRDEEGILGRLRTFSASRAMGRSD